MRTRFKRLDAPTNADLMDMMLELHQCVHASELKAKQRSESDREIMGKTFSLMREDMGDIHKKLDETCERVAVVENNVVRLSNVQTKVYGVKEDPTSGALSLKRTRLGGVPIPAALAGGAALIWASLLTISSSGKIISLGVALAKATYSFLTGQHP